MCGPAVRRALSGAFPDAGFILPSSIISVNRIPVPEQCEAVRNALFEYELVSDAPFDSGKASATTPSPAEPHLAQCEPCRRFASHLQSMRRTLAAHGKREHASTELRRRVEALFRES
jgi:hypothetical protein